METILAFEIDEIIYMVVGHEWAFEHIHIQRFIVKWLLDVTPLSILRTS
jgi:hypothetical protein